MNIFDTTHPDYIAKLATFGASRWNGAYYYAKEIEKFFIPTIKTDRNWVLLNLEGHCWDHSIVFCHNNRRPYRYEWLKEYNDLLLVCSLPSTYEVVKEYGTPILLPLSIDLEEIEKYKKEEKTKDICYVGRKVKAKWGRVPPGTDFLCGMPREQLLTELADYKRVYAIARCALEAKALGCEVVPFDPLFPDPDFWKVMDSRDAAKMLQKEIDKIDNKEK